MVFLSLRKNRLRTVALNMIFRFSKHFLNTYVYTNGQAFSIFADCGFHILSVFFSNLLLLRSCSNFLWALCTCSTVHSVFYANTRKAKANVYNTYIARPQAAYRSCSGAFYIIDKAGVQPISHRLSPRPRTLTCNQTAIRSFGLLFDGLNPRALLLIYRL